MFKRVEKRIRKKEKEEELGLDGDMKEMLGMHDTDSDESESSSDEDQDVAENEDDSEMEEDEEEGDEGGEEDASEDEDEDEDEGASASEEDEAPLTLSEALKDPLYTIEEEPEVKGCIVCPGKLLKNPVMIDVHLQSGVSLPPATKLLRLTSHLRLLGS